MGKSLIYGTLIELGFIFGKPIGMDCVINLVDCCVVMCVLEVFLQMYGI